jgi:erythromycin esterase
MATRRHTVQSSPAESQHSLSRSADLDPLLERIGNARIVLLGEASHGTHEYYTWRSAISKRLIKEKNFTCLAVEGDWPDCYQINRYIKGYEKKSVDPLKVLRQFHRWPTWMWGNWEVAALMQWLHDYNHRKTDQQKVGFYGLDVYSLWESMEVINDYLHKHDPEAAPLAKKVLRCFEPFNEEGHNYARAVSGMSKTCANEVSALLTEIRKKAPSYDQDPEAPLNTQMNANVIANAEAYYRAMVSMEERSWNVRDLHMVTALQTIMAYHGPESKVIVWEHNTHIGDARYTNMKDDGLWNVGQLVREQYKKEDVYVVGFASYEGSVIAGRNWGGRIEKMFVPPAIEESAEALLHEESTENRLLLFDEGSALKKRFAEWMPHRAIGVVYHPEYESGNYVPTVLSSRYDALIYLDNTTALHPLNLKPDGHLTPQTYPFNF